MTGDGFNNPVLGGDGDLVRERAKSPNYVTGATGWAINQDGSAEFNNVTIRGTVTAGTFAGTDFIVNSNGIFFYSGTPANGNLIGWWASSAGVDGFGNVYPAGLGLTNGTSLVKLVETLSQTGLIFNPHPATLSDGEITASYSTLSGETGLVIGAPYITATGTQAQLFLNSGDASNPPSIFSSTQTSIDSNMFTYSQGNNYNPAAGNVPLGAAPSNDVFVASATFTAEANRAYKVTGVWDGITTGGTQTNNHYVMRLKRGNSAGTIIMSQRMSATNINQNDCGGVIIAPPDTPYAGPNATASVTYTLTANHDVGTDSSTLITPAFVLVEGWQ